jgi:bifunctional DNA-binding transcriptional regulator/antitoxin component of YhaV-PrlF toxin-antitoxin module
MVEKNTSQLVKPLAKGQITILARFRRALGIDADTYLRITLEGRRLVLTLVRVVDVDETPGRDYTRSELEAFFAEDKLDSETVAKVKRFLEGNGGEIADELRGNHARVTRHGGDGE